MKALLRLRPSAMVRARRAARDPRDKRFDALLRAKCARAAGIGAITAAAESLPGLGKTLSLVFGELLDAEMLAATQRELIEETLALYEVRIPPAVRRALLRKIEFVGTGASLAGDALARGALRRGLSSLGGMLARRTVPVAAVASSAFANAATTYAIGQRTRALARFGTAPVGSLADAVRAFTGVDERRIARWSLAAARDTLAMLATLPRRVRRKRG